MTFDQELLMRVKSCASLSESTRTMIAICADGDNIHSIPTELMSVALKQCAVVIELQQEYIDTLAEHVCDVTAMMEQFLSTDK